MIYEKRHLHTLLSNENRNHIIEVRDKGQIILFTCSGADESYNFKLPSKDHDHDTLGRSSHNIDGRIYDAARASCIMDFQLAFTKTKSGGNLFDSNRRIFSHDFKTWFYNAAKHRILIPDTNSLINRSLSSLCFILGDEYLKDISIRIPRLTVLEMERMAQS